MTHKHDCKCLSCEMGSDAINAFEQEMLEKHGHTIRYIFDCHEFGGKVFPSIYTFGLTLLGFSHELECVLPINQKMATFLLNTLAFKQREGINFRTRQVYRIPELNNVPFYFIETIQKGSDIPVYRVILADESHLFPGDEGCHPVYACQELIGMEDLCC